MSQQRQYPGPYGQPQQQQQPGAYGQPQHAPGYGAQPAPLNVRAAPPNLENAAMTLQPLEQRELESARTRALVTVVIACLTFVTSWVVWVGFAAGLAAILSAGHLYDRTSNSERLAYGTSGVCCCCSGPMGQLRGTVTGITWALCLSVIATLLNIIILALGVVEWGSVSAWFGLFSIFTCFALSVACGFVYPAARRVNDVFDRIVTDLEANEPMVALGVVAVPVPAQPAQQPAPCYGHQQQQAKPEPPVPPPNDRPYGSASYTTTSDDTRV